MSIELMSAVATVGPAPEVAFTALITVAGLFGGGKERELDAAERLNEGLDRLDRSFAETLRSLERLHGVKKFREIAGIAVEYMVKVFDPEEAVVLIRRRPAVAEEDREQQLIVAASTGRRVSRGTVVTLGRGPLSRVVTGGVAFDRPPPPEASSELQGFRPEMAVPMTVDGGHFGVLALARCRQKPLCAMRLLQVVASTAAYTYKSTTALSRVRSEADLDPLTGVLNKGALTSTLREFADEARTSGRMLALFLFDIDHFKSYNDSNGHMAGDECLQLVSRLIAEQVRTDDAFGRWGGEEFLLLLRDRQPEDAVHVADKVRGMIAAYPVPNGERQPLGFVSISGGLAFLPDHGLEAEELLRSADTALYRAKNSGRNRVETARADRPEAAPVTAEVVESDDLTAIRGIGPAFAEGLTAQGIRAFADLAGLDWRSIVQVAEALGTTPERIVRERWLAQARELDAKQSDDACQTIPEAAE